MNIFEAIILGIVQALTEFFPVSSSGHLAIIRQLCPNFYGENVDFLTFTIIVHGGTLSAALIFLRRDFFELFHGLLHRSKSSMRILLLLLVGTIPSAIVGLAFKEHISALSNSNMLIGCCYLFTALILEITRRSKGKEEENTSENAKGFEKISFKDAAIIGLAQSLAILPGISRSGSTICMSLLLGHSGNVSVRYSFLLSLPVISGALFIEMRELTWSLENISLYGAGFTSALIAGIGAIGLLVKLVRRMQLLPFVIYTFLLGLFFSALSLKFYLSN